MEKELINHPQHYAHGDIECIDAMIAAKGIEKVMAFCELSVFKYNWRLGHKDDGVQEMSKMRWYVDKWMELNKTRNA